MIRSLHKAPQDPDLISELAYNLGNTNNKGDITNAGAFLVDKNTSDNTVDNCILRFFGDRTVDNGDASLGFWFYKSDISLNTDGSFSGTHTAGDLLIVVNYTRGGTVGIPAVYIWQADGTLQLQTSASAFVCAGTNTTAQDLPSGFGSIDGTRRTYAPNTFFEGAIDLCGAGLSGCFQSFLIESRNSQLINASLQDFALSRDFDSTTAAPNDEPRYLLSRCYGHRINGHGRYGQHPAVVTLRPRAARAAPRRPRPARPRPAPRPTTGEPADHAWAREGPRASLVVTVNPTPAAAGTSNLTYSRR